MNRNVTFYEQDHSCDELLYCPHCEEDGKEDGKVSVIEDIELAFCPDCHNTYSYSECKWKKNENVLPPPPPLKDIYSTTLVVEQGGFDIGDRREVKYRTTLRGTISENDELLTEIRAMKPMNITTLLKRMKVGKPLP